jgi:hypothetical protein
MGVGEMKNYATAERNGRSKLNWERVQKIREDHKKGQTQIWLAVTNELAQSTVAAIVHNRTWKKR